MIPALYQSSKPINKRLRFSGLKSSPQNLWFLLIYRRNFKPQIFTDITTPDKQSYSPNTGKASVLLMIW